MASRSDGVTRLYEAPQAPEPERLPQPTKTKDKVLLDEREDVFCLWRTRYRKNVKMLDYEVDLFRLQPDGAWERDFEEHHQRAYTVEELTAWLEETGFTAIRTHGELKLRRANERDGRIYFSCIRK